jgi:hypothetical protein
MKIDGSCHCGKIKFDAEVDPESVKLCHCTDCQVLSGSAFRSVVEASEEKFRLLSGHPRIYLKTAQSGNLRQQVFCADCGTQIYATAEGGSGRIFNLRVGTILQRNELSPRYQIWCRSAQTWLPDLSSIEKRDKQ